MDSHVIVSISRTTAKRGVRAISVAQGTIGQRIKLRQALPATLYAMGGAQWHGLKPIPPDSPSWFFSRLRSGLTVLFVASKRDVDSRPRPCRGR
jgi:hypothetical protein